jgi:CRISPR-associated protein Cas2
LVDAAEWVRLKAKLVQEIDPEHDSLRFYFLGNNWHNRLEHIGAKPSYNPEGPLVI